MGTRIDMIGLFVSDVQEMVHFYRDVLGFETDWDGEGPYAEFNHEGVRFSMYQRSLMCEVMGRRFSYPSGLNGTFELAIEMPTYADVDLEFDRVVKAGARPVYPPRNEPWGMRSSMVADPDGNLIEIGSWTPGAQEGEA